MIRASPAAPETYLNEALGPVVSDLPWADAPGAASLPAATLRRLGLAWTAAPGEHLALFGGGLLAFLLYRAAGAGQRRQA